MLHLLTHPDQLAALLISRRKALKLSQREMAQRLGISQGRFSTLEKKPQGLTLDRLLILVQALGMEIYLSDDSSFAVTNLVTAGPHEW